MPRIHRKTVTRSLAAGLAVCAIAPGTALAMPALAGPPVPANHGAGSASNPAPPAAASGAAGVTARDSRSLDYRAPNQSGSRGDGVAKQERLQDQADGHGRGLPVAPAGPQWPVNPQPITRPHSVATADPSTDGGVDTGVWIALAGAALALAGGIGFAGGKRLGTGRQGQLA
jgi:hypothetical protein